jgi:hypothetical protein
MATQKIYETACRRSHRLLAHYLVFAAWVRGVDCVALEKETLFRFLGLKGAMRNLRLRWLYEELAPMFPHQWKTVSSRTHAYHTLFLSRVPIPDGFKKGTMSCSSRIKRNASLLRAAIVPIPDEEEIVQTLAKVAYAIEAFPPPIEPPGQ